MKANYFLWLVIIQCITSVWCTKILNFKTRTTAHSNLYAEPFLEKLHALSYDEKIKLVDRFIEKLLRQKMQEKSRYWLSRIG